MKWLLLIPAILVSSCSSPSNNKIENKQEEKTIVENLESKAKRQMMATIKSLPIILVLSVYQNLKKSLNLILCM